jgi:hypothetical protein
LLAQHDAVRPNKGCAERVIPARKRPARHVESAAKMLLVVRWRAFYH